MALAIGIRHHGLWGVTVMTIERVVVPVTYRIEMRGRVSAPASVIVCLVCGMASHNDMDILMGYCARCHVYHDDRVEALREQFLLGAQPLPAGVKVVWGDLASSLDGSATDRVLCVHPEESAQGGNMDFAVKTPIGWRMARHGDWIVTLMTGEHVIDRGGVWLGLERSAP